MLFYKHLHIIKQRCVRSTYSSRLHEITLFLSTNNMFIVVWSWRCSIFTLDKRFFAKRIKYLKSYKLCYMCLTKSEHPLSIHCPFHTASCYDRKYTVHDILTIINTKKMFPICRRILILYRRDIFTTNSTQSFIYNSYLRFIITRKSWRNVASFLQS